MLNSVRSIVYTSDLHICTMEVTVILRVLLLNTGILLEGGKIKEDPGK